MENLKMGKGIGQDGVHRFFRVERDENKRAKM
jgi:hypothetical protein